MNLEILVPSGIFARVPEVSSIVAESQQGSFGILPRRRDCVAALAPGILTYRTASGTVYVAVDEGVLIKRRGAVTVSVKRCIRAATLATLHDTVIREFRVADAEEQAVRHAIQKMEGGLLGRLAEYRHER